MARCIDWEWCISEVEWLKSDEWGDILENDFSDSLADYYGDDLEVALKQGYECLPEEQPDDVAGIRLRLSVRRWETIDREITIDVDEAWVTPEMTLPEFTDSGTKIPQKVHRELAKFVKKIAG